MSTSLPPGYVIPNPGPAKTIGILNIVFASILILYGLVQVASSLLMPTIRTSMEANQRKMEADALKKHQDSIAEDLKELDEKEKAAKTDEEKAEIQAERERVKNRPKPFIPNTTIGLEMAADPKVMRFQIGEILTGLALNVPMLISGIGLIMLREWARRLAVWVAGLKILRLAIVLVFSMTILVPAMMRMMNKQMDAMATQIQQSQPGRAGVQQQMKQAGNVAGIAIGASYAGMYSLGMIYPAIALIVLTRPRVRAACIVASKPEPDVLS
jgi:hypothetical protein